MEPIVHRTQTRDGVTIAYTTSGAGPGLVLMPGVPFSNFRAEWQLPLMQRAFERLTGELTLVEYDGRGTGASQRDVDDLSLAAMVADLDAVLTVASLSRPTLLGFYNSCLPAIAFAARHPDRVHGLILFGGAARGWDPMSSPGTQALLSLIDRDWDTFAESAAHAWLGWPDDVHGRLAVEWFRTAATPAIARATMQSVSGMDVGEDLGRVSCPVLVLHRRGTSVIPLADSNDLVRRLPHARLQVLEGDSASLFLDGTDGAADAILAEVTGRSVVSSRPMAPPSGAPTPRQLEVLRLLAGGASNQQIATDLGISVNTVERHVANLYRAIGVVNRAEAAAYAIRRGYA